jgi:two-component system, cell cycle sensor histidine kinase and response regulator CckA
LEVPDGIGLGVDVPSRPGATRNGLGLSTVYGIIEQAQGDFGLSELDRSTTLKIYLPRVGDQSLADVPRAAPLAVSGTETVLLVDDERGVRKLISETLSQSGFRVLVASDGFEALALINQHRDELNLILTDTTMPR